MVNKQFGVFVLLAFIAATLLLLVINYNFSANMTTLLGGNKELLQELRGSNHLREIDRDILGVESRIRAAIATDDTTHLEGVDSKITTVMTYLDSIDIKEPDDALNVYLDRLRVLSKEKIRAKNELMKRYHTLGNMNDTTFIANPRARRISDEITRITQKIYDIRQQKMVALSQQILEGSKQAKVYGNVLMVFMFISGAVLCWYIFRQVRRKNRLITKLNASEKTALEALQVKENFLANMSHEIRTPLNSILGFTSLLKRQTHNANAAEFVEAIEKAGENLMAIINDILDLSKIEAGMMRIVPAPFSVRGLSHSIATLFKERLKEKGLFLNTTVTDDVPDTLIGDATRLTQILVNLIGNAIKFSNSGGITLSISSKLISDGTIHLAISVKDNGIGVSKEKLEKIFERFNQAEDSITRSYGGTGLGLSIVDTLIKLQHGNIAVVSEVGKGTEFNFYIPYRIADEQLVPEIHSNAATKHLMRNNIKLLVVDDNLMNQSLMKHLLTDWETSFVIVSNGLEALHELKNNHFDLVLMDIQMPIMDGYTAAKEIRDTLRLDVPIIAMTAHAMAGEREKCLSSGMNEYVSKPINEEILAAAIAKLVVVKQQPKPQPPVFYRVLDLSYMKTISKGNANYETIVTNQFITCIPEDINALVDAYRKEDLIALQHTAHNMKTSVAIMGLLPSVGYLLDSFEDAGNLNTIKASDLQKLKQICLAAVAEAKVFLQSIPV